MLNARCRVRTGFIVVACFVALAVFAGEDVSERPAIWAQPVQIEGVPNLHRVSDDLYRSAQPTAEGMQNIEAEGVKTIINLRSFHSDRDEIEDSGLGYEHIFMKAWHPERKEAVRFLKIVTDSERTPVLVHCQHGADRTGVMCAIYRVAVQGWTKDEALEEMTKGGFGFHRVWANLPGWFRELDIDAIKRDAGLILEEDEEPSKPDAENDGDADSAGGERGNG